MQSLSIPHIPAVCRFPVECTVADIKPLAIESGYFSKFNGGMMFYHLLYFTHYQKYIIDQSR